MDFLERVSIGLSNRPQRIIEGNFIMFQQKKIRIFQRGVHTSGNFCPKIQGSFSYVKDELARQGSDSPFVGPEPALPITLSWVKSEVDKARVLHTRYWNNKPDHQHSKLFLKEPLDAVSRKILNMIKKRLRLLVGTWTLQCNNHLFNIQM